MFYLEIGITRNTEVVLMSNLVVMYLFNFSNEENITRFKGIVLVPVSMTLNCHIPTNRSRSTVILISFLQRIKKCLFLLHFFNLFQAIVPFSYHLKTSEALWFSDIFREDRSEATLDWFLLMVYLSKHSQIQSQG